MESPTETKSTESKTLIATLLSSVLLFSPAQNEAKTSEAARTPLSVTAFAVAEAYSNAYLALSEAQTDALSIHKKEIDTQRAIVAFARTRLSTTNKILFSVISSLPSSLESALLNKMVEQSYGNLLLLRKLMIKQQIRTAIADGAIQIVFLGAGLDIRGLYTAQDNPDVQVFELDQAAMQEAKQEAFNKVLLDEPSDEKRLPKNLHLIKADINGPWLFKLLLSEQFDLTKKTLYIAEGLTMYMTEAENIAFLRDIQERMKPEDALLISFMSQIKTNAVIDSSMQAQKERFGFGLEKISSIDFLAQQGLEPKAWFESSQHLQELNDISGNDYFKETERPQEYYLLLKRSSDGPKLAHDLYDYPQIKLALSKPESGYHPIL